MRGPDDIGQLAAVRCPLCTSAPLRRTAAGFWCVTCDLVTTGSPAEWDAMEPQREAWAAGTHPLQVTAPPLPPVVDVPHDGWPCQQCGQRHATRPERPGPRPPEATTRNGARRGRRRPRGDAA